LLTTLLLFFGGPNEGDRKRTYIPRLFSEYMLTSIALLLTGKISPLLIPPTEMEKTLNFVQGHLTPLRYQVLRQTPQYY
jgi:hypothetical protein